METSKIKKGKSKTTYFFFFILNFDRQTTELMKKYPSGIQIFGRLLTRVFHPEF